MEVGEPVELGRGFPFVFPGFFLDLSFFARNFMTRDSSSSGDVFFLRRSCR